ncbi:MAG: HAD-IC family P-type ATPase [Corallococcus sp.]|nr:HAD-IC family P-type ATPase [Corallococcus sp.]MCM1358979.1 HAD-IC family P-type ATPase [Corallococcus sp.]MCM1394968.1 HAD-IC family P-type ATPase [Corallococcus sp.]
MSKRTTKKQQIERIQADINQGLSQEDVKRRVAAKMTNRVKKVVGKSYLQIFMSNIFTFFNAIGLFIFFIMILVESPANALGIVIVLANTAIGIFQEIRSKLAVEKLSIVSEPTVTVVRDGVEQTIATRDIVLDDVLLLSAGKQVCTDCSVIIGEVEVNESMLTGESDAVKKKAGDTLYSGSYVISGNCTVRCEKVGKDNYVQQLSARVKKAKMPDSQLMKGIRRIIKFLAVIIVPLGIATFFCSTQIKDLIGMDGVNVWNAYWSRSPEKLLIAGEQMTVRQGVNQALISMSGSMLGMVPSGMVLLTSVALAVAALKLARKKVLVRELPCIEMLARVDTLCLDKTGTITDGSMTVQQIIPLGGFTEDQIKRCIAGVVSATGDDNMTALAIKNYTEGTEVPDSSAHVPFSSARKYSAATLTGFGTVALGAAEFMFKKTDKSFNAQCTKLLKQGLRVLAVGHTKKAIKGDAVEGLSPAAIVVLQDTIRPDAPEIIGWFRDNNVDVKVISGDNPLSVSVIAQSVGVKDADKYVSLDGMTDEEVMEAANKYTVFGRVTPEQKALLVKSMKQAGRTVAMTGDGVNDILAMRESDCAISVGCGTDAAKTVANLVLMDNKFSQMPKVVAEGRQVVNNIQNSSSLFLMKTCMVMLTTILCLCMQVNYPFAPNQLYTFEFFIDGIPSFFLALKPNHNLIKGKFLTNTLKSTLPSGLAMFLSIAMTYAFAGVLGLGLSSDQLSSVAMFSMTATGVVALLILLFPYDKINIGIGLFGSLGAVASFWILPWMFDLMYKIGLSKNPPEPMFVTDIGGYSILFIALNAVVMGGIIVGLKFLVRYIDKRMEKKTALSQQPPQEA